MAKKAYFTPEPKTCEELKKQYRALAMKHHPDCGGDTETMKAVNNEYDKLWPKLKNIHTTKDGEEYTRENHEAPQAFREVIDALVRMEGIAIEVIGSFVWVSGNTKIYKDAIKGMGFRWHAKKTMWYLAPDGYRKRSKKNFSMDEIRDMYGSEEVKTNPSDKIA